MAPFHRVLAAASLLALVATTSARADWPHLPGTSSLICGATGHQFSTLSAPDGQEGTFVVWDDYRAGTAHAYIQHLDRWGRPLWTSGGQRVAPTLPFSGGAHVESDGQGGCFVVCVGPSTGLLFHFDASGSSLWSPVGVSIAPTSVFQPRVLADGNGGCFVVWADYRSGSYDVYAQRFTSAGVPAWTVGGVVVVAASGDQYTPRLVSDARGGVIVSWKDYSVSLPDIVAQRLDVAGNRLWSSSGVNVASFSNSRAFTDGIVPDGEGGAIFAWTESRSGVYDVYTQRINGIGNRTWGADGSRPCVTVANRVQANATTDGVGGAIVVYSDPRFTPNAATYVQRVGPDGAPLWATDGVYVSSGAIMQRDAGIVSDGRGGAIVAWRDGRANPVVRMYAQRVDANGVTSWTTNGVNLGVAGFEVEPPAMALSERGAIAAWFADRGTGYDAYGQRVDAYGNLGAPEPRITGVADVPNDQGGRVRVAWNASWLDGDPSQQVSYYSVLRSVPAAAALRRVAAGERAVSSEAGAPESGSLWTTRTGAQEFYWESIGSTSALHFVSGYSFLAPTAGDSVAGSNPSTAYMVVAQNFGGQYWLSAPDSGYSVDDLAPAAPAPFTGQYAFGTMRLHWDPNAETDLSGYRLYRGNSPDFVPGPGNLVATPADTGYADLAFARFHYKLTAVDVHGNESPVATFSPSGTVGVDDVPVSADLSFATPSPNPARGATTLRFTLAVAGRATLALYDASGRRVRTLRSGDAAAGAHAESFDLRDDEGRALPPGLYLARLDAGGRSLTRRLVIAN